MSYLNTIAWLNKTFTTRQRTAELLRPELEKHVISQHDYELAIRFLPGPSLDWHLAYGVGTPAAVYGYGSYLARPKWTTWRLRFGAVAAFLVGSTYGTFRQFMLHYRFANSLEGPQGFIVALNHVDERLGGSGGIGLAFREILVKKPEVESDLDYTGHTQDADVSSDEASARVRDDVDGERSSQRDSTQLKTRWDEIRAANLRTAGQSSWDAIRQRHERGRLPDLTDAAVLPTERSSITEVDERAIAQAKFDALLDAERHRGQSQGDRE